MSTSLKRTRRWELLLKFIAFSNIAQIQSVLGLKEDLHGRKTRNFGWSKATSLHLPRIWYNSIIRHDFLRRFNCLFDNEFISRWKGKLIFHLWKSEGIQNKILFEHNQTNLKWILVNCYWKRDNISPVVFNFVSWPANPIQTNIRVPVQI